MDHTRCYPCARRGNVQIPPGRHRIIRRLHSLGRKPGRDLGHQRPQFALDIRVLIQQVREPVRPPLRQNPLNLLKAGARSGELLMSPRQPLLRSLSLSGITAAQQPRKPGPR